LTTEEKRKARMPHINQRNGYGAFSSGPVGLRGILPHHIFSKMRLRDGVGDSPIPFGHVILLWPFIVRSFALELPFHIAPRTPTGRFGGGVCDTCFKLFMVASSVRASPTLVFRTPAHRRNTMPARAIHHSGIHNAIINQPPHPPRRAVTEKKRQPPKAPHRL